MRAKAVTSEGASFDRVQRILHWSIGVDVAGLIVTGLPVYLSEFLVNPPTVFRFQFVYWGVVVWDWRVIHIDFGLLLVALIALHASWDAYHLKRGATLRTTWKDLHEITARARNFLGKDREYFASAPPKYDALQKAFHWSLIILGHFSWFLDCCNGR